MRAAFRRGIAVRRDVVDLLLTFNHAAQVVIQRYALLAAFALRGGKTQQFSNRLLIGAIFCRSLFQYQTKLFPELLILLCIIFCQFFQHLQAALSQRGAQALGDTAVLQNFT